MSNKKTEKIYETCFHINPNLSEKEAEISFKGVEGLIKESNGESISHEEPKHMDLMYSIKDQERIGNNPYERFDSSYFASIKFQLSVDSVDALKAEIIKDKSIFRIILFESTRESQRIEMVVEGEEGVADTDKK